MHSCVSMATVSGSVVDSYVYVHNNNILLHFRSNSGYVNSTKCYLIRTLSSYGHRQVIFSPTQKKRESFLVYHLQTYIGTQ